VGKYSFRFQFPAVLELLFAEATGIVETDSANFFGTHRFPARHVSRGVQFRSITHRNVEQKVFSLSRDGCFTNIEVPYNVDIADAEFFAFNPHRPIVRFVRASCRACAEQYNKEYQYRKSNFFHKNSFSSGVTTAMIIALKLIICQLFHELTATFYLTYAQLLCPSFPHKIRAYEA